VKNLDVHRDSESRAQRRMGQQRFLETVRGRWAVGCAKDTAGRVGQDGRVVFASKGEGEGVGSTGAEMGQTRPVMRRAASHAHSIRIKTDNISFRPPEMT
jgi:hypothetical protein